MKHLLLTGFEPFLNNPINPTQTIAQKLNSETIGNYRVYSHVLPVDYSRSSKVLISKFEELNPDAVLMLGLAKGRSYITPERIAINCNGGPKDNTGMVTGDQKIDPSGLDGYFSKLPIHHFVEALHEENLPSSISNTAGTYLCNNVMYSMLNYLYKTKQGIPAGFVHVPASHELSVLLDENVPSWSTEDLVRGIRKLISVL
ncbi:pyroglutamyl-peptidase I [Sporolactobacillus vineae]|uniref:pyroglutamyl-peptidase I n=1 Tax=Sporolactobacillus vineae TaxID=444463 RepID=UPI000287F32C|nr:pyroglutamyl-peptidase I [Sporolactobacillus vineae]